MAEMGTDTASETPVATEVQEVETTETAETPAADTETAEAQAGTEAEETRTPEQIEIDNRAAAIAKSKAGTDPVIQKRIDKLTRQAKLEAENAYLKGQLEAVERFGLKPQAPKAEVKPDTPPQPENFETTADYVKAYSDYSVKQALSQVEAANTRKAQEAQRQQEQAKIAERASEITAKGSELYEDFEDVTSNRSPFAKVLTDGLADAIMDSGEMAHVIEYHLATNIEEAKRLAGLKPVAMAREMLKLESTLRAALQPKTTQTPAPIKPLKGGATPAIDESKLSDQEAVKLEMKRLNESRKGRV